MSAASISPLDRGSRRERLSVRGGTIRALIVRGLADHAFLPDGVGIGPVFGFLNLVVYHYISTTLRPRPGHGLGGAPSYFAFAAVGLALTIVLQAAIIGVGRRLREEQLTGTLEAIMVQPVSPTELALGLAGFPFTFACVRALVYLGMAGAFLGLSFARCNWLGLFVSFVVSGLSYAALGVTLAALVLVFKRAEALGSAAAVALSLVGGALFPIAALPHWLQTLSHLVPTRYAFEAVRNAVFGTGSWAGPVLILLGIGVLMMACALPLFHAALRLVIRRGTISQY